MLERRESGRLEWLCLVSRRYCNHTGLLMTAEPNTMRGPCRDMIPLPISKLDVADSLQDSSITAELVVKTTIQYGRLENRLQPLLPCPLFDLQPDPNVLSQDQALKNNCHLYSRNLPYAAQDEDLQKFLIGPDTVSAPIPVNHR